jgi:hypothetical protein
MLLPPPLRLPLLARDELLLLGAAVLPPAEAAVEALRSTPLPRSSCCVHSGFQQPARRKKGSCKAGMASFEPRSSSQTIAAAILFAIYDG